MSDDAERKLRMDLMAADLQLKRKQLFWETPRNLAVVLGAVAALAGALAGTAGYLLGSRPAAPVTVILKDATH